MSDHYAWLPQQETFGSYYGDWSAYVEAIYSIFKADFVDSQPVFRGRRLGLKRHPVELGKEATFWHFVSEGKSEADRLPDLKRCERIRWPRPTIQVQDMQGVHIWAEKPGHEQRIYIYLEHEGYLVVLAERSDYLLPWTAYPVEREHQRRKLLRRALDAQKS